MLIPENEPLAVDYTKASTGNLERLYEETWEYRRGLLQDMADPTPPEWYSDPDKPYLVWLEDEHLRSCQVLRVIEAFLAQRGVTADDVLYWPHDPPYRG